MIDVRVSIRNNLSITKKLTRNTLALRVKYGQISDGTKFNLFLIYGLSFWQINWSRKISAIDSANFSVKLVGQCVIHFGVILHSKCDQNDIISIFLKFTRVKHEELSIPILLCSFNFWGDSPIYIIGPDCPVSIKAISFNFTVCSWGAINFKIVTNNLENWHLSIGKPPNLCLGAFCLEFTWHRVCPTSFYFKGVIVAKLCFVLFNFRVRNVQSSLSLLLITEFLKDLRTKPLVRHVLTHKFWLYSKNSCLVSSQDQGLSSWNLVSVRFNFSLKSSILGWHIERVHNILEETMRCQVRVAERGPLNVHDDFDVAPHGQFVLLVSWDSNWDSIKCVLVWWVVIHWEPAQVWLLC